MVKKNSKKECNEHRGSVIHQSHDIAKTTRNWSFFVGFKDFQEVLEYDKRLVLV